MTMPKYLHDIYSIIEKAKIFGYKDVSNGAKLIGHAPHVAPEAYFHLIFPGLDEKDIHHMESQLGKGIPVPLATFYFINNGISIFSGSLSIDGLRRNYSREGDDVWQPFNIVDLNTFDAPPDTEENQLFFGGYQDDGSLLYVDLKDLSVYRCTRDSTRPLNAWPSFEEMLLSETQRLSELFDEKGILIKGVKSTAPKSSPFATGPRGAKK
jgi:hypothetical protein